MTNLIDHYLQQADAADQAAEAEKQANIQNWLTQLREAMAPHLAQFQEAGAAVDQAVYQADQNDRAVKFRQERVTLPGFEPFYVVAIPNGFKGIYIRYQPYDEGKTNHYFGKAPVDPADEVAVGRFLRARKAAFDEKVAERLEKEAEERAKQVDSLTRDLHYKHNNNYYFLKTPAEVEAVLAKLAELAPQMNLVALRQDWQAEYAKYLEAEAEKERQAAALRVQQQAYQVRLDAYRAAYAAYKTELERVQAINRERFPALQARWNTPFEVYDLHYALYVRDEDGEAVETDSVICLAPLRNDFHVEIKRNGQAQSFLYNASHVIKISAPYTVTPVGFKQAGKIDVAKLTGADLALRYLAGIEREKVEADLRATFEPLPAEPDTTGLNYDDVRRVEHGDTKDDPLY